MKTFFLAAGLMMVFSSTTFAKPCEEHLLRTKIKQSLEANVGQSAGGDNYILKVVDIKVITTTDIKGNIKALFSFKQTMGTELGGSDNMESNMLGYGKFSRLNCKQLDGIILGSFTLN
ncbi:MAG: hypothetical protein ACOYL6_18025 [Bacteriovoracaceae bacterium]